MAFHTSWEPEKAIDDLTKSIRGSNFRTKSDGRGGYYIDYDADCPTRWSEGSFRLHVKKDAVEGSIVELSKGSGGREIEVKSREDDIKKEFFRI